MEVKPFQAFRFDANVVGDVGTCIAPPYDVISPAQQEQLYAMNRYNIVRIIKGKTTLSDNGQDNQYTRAAECLRRWIQEGALKQDPEEAVYGYVQDFELGGLCFKRLSFIALAKLEEFGQIVKPHEQVFDKPMMDRLNLKKATGARFGLVFMLYEDSQRIADIIIEKAAAQKPLVDFVDEQNVRHRLFAITSRADIDQITRMMSDKNCIIADGHHRYTTGLTYSRENPNPGTRYQMLAFTNTCQNGLLVLATHRLVGNLEDFDCGDFIAQLKRNFELAEFKFDQNTRAKTDARQKMLAQMKAEHDKDRSAFGV